MKLKLGNTIKLVRKKKDISQELLAFSSEIDRRHMSKIENGKVDIKVITLQKILIALDISISDFFLILENSVNKN